LLQRHRLSSCVSVALRKDLWSTGGLRRWPFDPPTMRGQKGDSRPLGRSRGGFTSKLRCLADALGQLQAFHLTVGEAAECKAYDALIGQPERAPGALLADKGYDAHAIRFRVYSLIRKAAADSGSPGAVKPSHLLSFTEK